VVRVDTDVSVPQLVGTLRIDLYEEDGTWFDTRQYTLASPLDLPASFSVYTTGDADRVVLVRVRAFPEGRAQDYLGETSPTTTPFVEPETSTDLASACAAAIPLDASGSASLRVGAAALAGAAAAAPCSTPVAGGSAVARVDIAATGQYTLEVVSSVPAANWPEFDTPTIAIRTSCTAATSQVGCGESRVDPSFGTVLPKAQVMLSAGSYTVVVSNRAPTPMDAVIRVTRTDASSPAAPAPPTPPATPRLLVDGADVTPNTEPQPLVTIDRLTRVALHPGTQTHGTLTLHGECFGTRADLSARTSCVDTADVRVALDTLEDTGTSDVPPSSVGSWSANVDEPCKGTPPAATGALQDERVCVLGRAFVLGDWRVIGDGAASGTPERIVRVPPMYFDKYEMTVGRYRDAVRRGFHSPDATPVSNPSAITDAYKSETDLCTWNAGPSGEAVVAEREAQPLTCVSWYAATALCSFLGGQLPTAAQWEYAATASGKPFETLFASADTPPTCDQEAYGRWRTSNGGATDCIGSPFGPSAVDAMPWAAGDVTPLGIVGLGGNVAEWTQDGFRRFDDPCWRGTGLVDTRCAETAAPLRSVGGGSWYQSLAASRGASRFSAPAGGSTFFVGLRCVYRGDVTP
jgi:formylglycine-generating enzyme required for sulfatase activity